MLTCIHTYMHVHRYESFKEKPEFYLIWKYMLSNKKIIGVWSWDYISVVECLLMCKVLGPNPSNTYKRFLSMNRWWTLGLFLLILTSNQVLTVKYLSHLKLWLDIIFNYYFLLTVISFHQRCFFFLCLSFAVFHRCF
jgi:hypothetical protein